MNLTDEQKQIVSQWLSEGTSVADVQNKLSGELKISMTYMEVRFLLDDLALAPQDAEEEATEEPVAEVEEPEEKTTVDDNPEVLPPPGQEQTVQPPEPDLGATNVSVAVDQLVRPGCLASGKVTFTDGKQANWQFDQFGRLSIEAEEEGYKPPEADVMAFQQKLQAELSKMGM